MIRGIKKKWIQPICFNFFHSYCPAQKLKLTIFYLIAKLKNIGLTVCILINDMGFNNIQLSKILEITPSIPYFSVNEQIITYIFDIPHLFKAIKNTLKKI